MNILYISYLMGAKWEGPNYSVPSQIKAQAKYDNVLWFNLNHAPKEMWDTDVSYINLNNVPGINISCLPRPFNNPDLAIFEGLYTLDFCRIAKQLRKLNVPYIIIPRSSLTSSGQSSKALKKKIGNLVFFNTFIKNAAAIQYLTPDEYKSSGDSWNKTSIIIPNGIERKNKTKAWQNHNTLKGVFIGRKDIYQKGIDLLIKACAALRDQLISAGCTIDIYGPDSRGANAAIDKLISENGLRDIISLHDEVFDDEKEKVLLNSDFFILTSRFEGHPMGLIEALSYGLPCLVTSGTNMGDKISKYDAGWTAETDVEGIANALKNILNDKDKLALKGQNAMELSKQYDWDMLAEVSAGEYIKLLDKSNQTAEMP